jgi:hypothetical protein
MVSFSPLATFHLELIPPRYGMADMGKASMESERRRIAKMERESATEKSEGTTPADVGRVE